MCCVAKPLRYGSGIADNPHLESETIAPPPPPTAIGKDTRRERALSAFGLDDLADDAELSSIVEFAGKLCGAPVSLVTTLDGSTQHFLAKTGIEANETPRDVSFCTYAIQSTEMMEVRDTTVDERFRDNPFVTGEEHVRYYAGVPLVSQRGDILGTLCVLDREARPDGLDTFQREGMELLARAVMRRLESHRKTLAGKVVRERGEAMFRMLANSIPDLAWSADASGKRDYFNKRWHEFTGTKDGGDGHLIHPDDRDETYRKWDEAVKAGTPYEAQYRLRHRDGSYRWMLGRAMPVEDADGSILRWFGTITDIDSAHREAEGREILARELSHRIKNIFALVSGLVALKAREFPEAEDYAIELGRTIQALGRAHDFIRPGHMPGGKGGLRDLLKELLAPYDDKDGDRVTIAGDDVPVTAQVSTPFALVFHELATNAAKYGALSDPDGKVEVTVARGDDGVAIDWVEQGGPPAQEAEQEGFGTRLITMTVDSQLNGKLDREWRDSGLHARLTVPESSL